MNSKTDKKFIYDYLIHLDSFLLHGVSEVGTPQPKILASNSLPKKSNFPPLSNKHSPIAFVSINCFSEENDKIFNPEEFQLFNKIVLAMGLNPDDIYLTSVNKSNKISADKNTLTLIAEELSQLSSFYIVCLGNEVANYFALNKIEEYDLHSCWQETNMFNRNIILITIPTIKEMLDDPRHKKIAWAHLKKAADQLLN